MNLERLRSATRPDHEAAENAMPVMEPELDLKLYASILVRLHSLIRDWEYWAEANAPADLAEVVSRRQRRSLLEQDLAVLGYAPIDKVAAFPEADIPGLRADDPRFRASFLGAMYVLEGSTLGGQYIARHVQQVLRLEPGQGDAYFRGYGERTGEMWHAFKALLHEVPEEQSDDVIVAARAMFAVFQKGMRN